MGGSGPVIMTPQCNLPEGFAAGAAIKVEPDAEAIVAGLGAAFGMSADERKAMGQRGLELVRRRFTWAGGAEQMLGVYRWLLDGGAAPECMFDSAPPMRASIPSVTST
jgi:poly(glycerol-phosphate) alpha-glucosyltransferase